MAKKTYTKEERRAQFLKTGIALAKKGGLNSVTAVAVAAKHEVTAPLVFHIFGSRENLREAIMVEAKKQGVELPAPTAKRKPNTPTSARKRSIAEVKAIKDKVAGKRPVAKKAAGTKVAKKAADTKVAKKAAGTKAAKKAADTKVAEKRPAVQKYPTQPVPTINMVGGEPKASI